MRYIWAFLKETVNGMASTLPYMPLYVFDLESDEDCRMMTDAEFGRYMRLLIRQWVEGGVPADPVKAIRTAMLDPDSVASVKSLLDRKFSLVDGERRMNGRCAEEREKAVQKVETNRANGARGGRPPKTERLSDGLATEKPNGSIRASGSVSGSKPPEKQNGRIPRARDPDAFDRFWAVVHHRVGKGAARKAFAAAVKRGATAERLIERMAAFAKTPSANPTDRTPIHPTTWLNQERYDDDDSTWNRRSGPDNKSRIQAEPGKYDNVARRVGNASTVDHTGSQ